MRLVTPMYLILVLFKSQISFAQPATYAPRSTYTIRDLRLLKKVNKLLDEEVVRIKHKSPIAISDLNDERKKYLNDLLENKAIIHDSTLQQSLTRILKRIEDANNLPPKHRFIFIIKDPSVNAHCIGNGVFLVNVGLLGRVESEGQLAFVLAHEIAHDELQHNQQKMIWLVETKFSKKQKERIKDMLDGDLSMEDINDFREANLAYYRNNRKKEFEADSLGYSYFKNTGYHQVDAIEMLENLDKHNSSKYRVDVEMFSPLHADEYPFEEHWLNPRLAVYNKKLDNDFLYNLDSLSTHPDIPQRIEILESLTTDQIQGTAVSDPLVEEAIRMAEFETVESSFFLKQYDKCLLQALTLLQKYPGEPYLVARVSGILLQLYIAKNDEMTDLYVSSRTVGYSDELKVVNNFLHNISAKETGEILLNLLLNPDNFNEQNRDQYFILWKIAEFTYQYDLQRKVAAEYKDHFQQSISSHDYTLHTIRKLNLFDFYLQWGWVFL